ncbi:MAG: homocysteine S-methyltransferase [Ilumatobacteraceae bacterium]
MSGTWDELVGRHEGSFVVVDGGLSTALEELGERPGGALWTAAALVERPHIVTAAHRRAVEAGADVVISASYQASIDGFVSAGLDRRSARQVLASTTRVARESGAPVVAASVGPFGAVLADGSEYHGRYGVEWSTIRRFHRERLTVLVDTGPDLFAIETIPSAIEAEIIVDELRRLSTAPAWVSFSCRDSALTCRGDEFTLAVGAVADAVDMVGVNCTAPANITPLLVSAASVAVPFVVYPNHGAVWDAVTETWSGSDDARAVTRLAGEWYAAGARAIGGCCGIGAASIASLAAYRDSLEPV